MEDGEIPDRPLHTFPNPLYFILVVWFGHSALFWIIATVMALQGVTWQLWVFSSLLGGLFFVPALRLLLGWSQSTTGISLGSALAFSVWLIGGSILSRGGAWVCCSTSLFLCSMLMAAIVADDQREAYALWREDRDREIED